MLQRLEIHNVALIDHVSIELGKGLNVLTGETGAGKSIIIDSINAILGDRISRDIIRTGKEKAIVEAVFQIEGEKLHSVLESIGIEPEEDGTLVISREFTTGGKNTCRINGRMSTVSVLKEIGEHIIDIHGQYDNQSLLRTESHIDLLDSFGGEDIYKLKYRYAKVIEKYRELKTKLKGLSGDSGERERRIDLLKYQIEEIKKSKLKKNEEDELSKQRLILGNSEKITNSMSRAYELLFSGNTAKNSAYDNISLALSEINSLNKLDEKYSFLAKKIEELTYQLDDIIEEIRRDKDSTEFNPALMEQVDERLDLIYKLKKKYGNSISDVLEYCKKIEAELEQILGSEELIISINSELTAIREQLYDLAVKINSARQEAAKTLESKIGAELDDLEMKKAQFKVKLEFDSAYKENGSRKFLNNGLDQVEFLISPNAGEPLKPLSKIASGGEMSRIMLAIKTILADVDRMPTLIFDEIDIGISGRAAQKVGEKLSYLSRKHQVICVTHLAQIACMSDSHYLIEKLSSRDSTSTSVRMLEGKALQEEIARILGGANISDITLKHAGEMIRNANLFKKA